MMVVKALLLGGPVFQAEGRGSADAAVRAVVMPLDQPTSVSMVGVEGVGAERD